MPPQNILISLRYAPLHQDILHRELDKRQYSIYTEKGNRATDQPLLPQSHFSAVDCFYRDFSQSFKKWYEDGNEYLLHTPDGKQFIYRNYYDSYWTPVMELIGCSHKPHDTRHTCISMMTEKEVSPTLIKKIVGHSGAMSLTEKVYTHVNVQELLDAINKI